MPKAKISPQASAKALISFNRECRVHAQFLDKGSLEKSNPALKIHTFSNNKAEIFAALTSALRNSLAKTGFNLSDLLLCEQVHGKEITRIVKREEWRKNQRVALFDETVFPPFYPKSDGLLFEENFLHTANMRVAVYLADCCGVIIFDKVERVGAILHSGRKGSELQITRNALNILTKSYGTRIEDLRVFLSPCIRDCCYDYDFSELILTDLLEAGISLSKIFDGRACSACSSENYFSFRRDCCRSGRMFLLI